MERRVVTAFVVSGGRIALLRRSAQVRTYRGKWAAVSGSIPDGVSPHEQALREIEEETGLSRTAVTLVREGAPLRVEDQELGVSWLVHPFAFSVEGPVELRLDWEHDEARWVSPDDLAAFDTVPSLEEAWRLVSEK